jgi:hypothetical protein
MKRIFIAIYFLAILNGMAEEPSDGRFDNCPIAHTTIVINGTIANGGIIKVTYTGVNGKLIKSVSYETKKGETVDDVVEHLEGSIKGLGGSITSVSHFRTSIYILNAVLGEYAISSTDSGITFPRQVEDLRAEYDSQGRIILHWKKPDNVEYVIIRVRGSTFDIAKDESFVDDRKGYDGDFAKSWLYMVVSIDKNGSPGGYTSIVFPKKQKEDKGAKEKDNSKK